MRHVILRDCRIRGPVVFRTEPIEVDCADLLDVFLTRHTVDGVGAMIDVQAEGSDDDKTWSSAGRCIGATCAGHDRLLLDRATEPYGGSVRFRVELSGSGEPSARCSLVVNTHERN